MKKNILGDAPDHGEQEYIIRIEFSQSIVRKSKPTKF